MPNPESPSDSCCSIRLRPLIAGAALGLVGAVGWTLMSGPRYEATAYIETASEAGLPTLEEKLRFPSLYRQVTESDDAARDLRAGLA